MASEDVRDPVRLRFIEALARRAQGHEGEARRILDDKVAKLLAAYGEQAGKKGCEESAGREAPPARGPLAELVDHIARHAPAAGAAASDAASGRAPLAELKTLSYFRSTWSKLSADRWLTQSLAKMPANAGPLHSHQLVHRSLSLMRDLSPDYLNRFMAYVDTLSWLDQMNTGAAAAASAARAEGAKKGSRSKGG